MSISGYRPGDIFGNDDQSGENMVRTLEDRLKTLPTSMVIFSTNLRSLFAELQVTGQDESTRTFLEVRDSARKNGVVYSKAVLPLTESVIRSIGGFADYFTDLEFEDWSDCLDDIVADIEKAHGVCEMLKDMHNTIIVDLKKNEDKATVGVLEIKKMTLKFEEEERKLRTQAAALSTSADIKRVVGVLTAPFTLGISAFIFGGLAANDEMKSKEKLATAVAKQENKTIALKAVELTSGTLIPAIQNFIGGLEIITEGWVIKCNQMMLYLDNYLFVNIFISAFIF